MTQPLKERIELGKSAFSLLRDILLFGAVVTLVFIPEWVNDRLSRAGVAEANLGIVKWSQESKNKSLKIAAQIEALTVENRQLQADLAKLKVSNPGASSQIAAIEQSLVANQRTLESTDKDLKASIAKQQAVIRQVAPATPLPTGWMYLGAIDESKSKWSGSVNSNADWPIGPGQSAKIVTDTYLRADSAAIGRSAARQIGVAKIGQSIRILEVESSTHLRRGGWTVWAKVVLE